MRFCASCAHLRVNGIRLRSARPRLEAGEAIERFVDAGFDHGYVHQVGHDQDGFFGFYERELLTVVKGLRADAKERIHA
jgi:hypothetical protein